MRVEEEIQITLDRSSFSTHIILYANKITRQIEYYLRNYRIYITYRERDVTKKLSELYKILIPKLGQPFSIFFFLLFPQSLTSELP